jgi:hypothetical protein
MRPISRIEKAAILLGTALMIVVAMALVSGLLLGHQAGNAPNNIVMTGGE